MEINIAIDGFSSCGKSTLAKALSKKIGYKYIDTGAMYRAVTLYFLENNISINNVKEVNSALNNIDVTFQNIEGNNTTFLNGINVENTIRSSRVANFVSQVATIKAVREQMVNLQKRMGILKSVVMDGRDIGTVVFPDAELKIFVTADPDIRAERRYNEMISKGYESDLEEIKTNLNHRDKLDSTREISPLKQAIDAILLDNSEITQEEQLEIAYQYYLKIKESL